MEFVNRGFLFMLCLEAGEATGLTILTVFGTPITLPCGICATSSINEG